MVALRKRTAVVVCAGNGSCSDLGARAIAKTLGDLGTDIVFLGREESAPRIAASAARVGADAVEVCISGSGGVMLLRELLRELARVDLRGVSIVVHRVH